MERIDFEITILMLHKACRLSSTFTIKFVHAVKVMKTKLVKLRFHFNICRYDRSCGTHAK